MKKILLVFVLISSFSALSQEEKEKEQVQEEEQEHEQLKNIFKLNAVPLFSGEFEFQYERILSTKSSIQIGFGTGGKEITDREEFQDLHLSTFGRTLNNPRNTTYSEKTLTLNIDYKYYFTEEQIPKGLYFSPSLQYIHYEERFVAEEQESFGNNNGEFGFNDRLYEREFKLYNLRALIGYQFIVAKLLTLNPYFGPSFLVGDATDFFDREDTEEKGFALNAGFYVGIGF